MKFKVICFVPFLFLASEHHIHPLMRSNLLQIKMQNLKQFRESFRPTGRVVEVKNVVISLIEEFVWERVFFSCLFASKIDTKKSPKSPTFLAKSKPSLRPIQPTPKLLSGPFEAWRPLRPLRGLAASPGSVGALRWSF